MKKEEMIQTSDCSVERSLYLLYVCVYICLCTLACLMMHFHGKNGMNHRINLVFESSIHISPFWRLCPGLSLLWPDSLLSNYSKCLQGSSACLLEHGGPSWSEEHDSRVMGNFPNLDVLPTPTVFMGCTSRAECGAHGGSRRSTLPSSC